MENLFFVPAIALAIWGIVSSIVIVSYLSDRGIQINFPLIRLYVIKYVHQYRKMTQEEQGRPGFWFYSFVVSMNAALVLAVTGLILL
ncbi:hypothetical protein JW948_13505 [bacterium]|nr:hypothetical protein [bacterium]